MSNEELKQRISEIMPGLDFEEKQYLTLTIHPDAFIELAPKLKEDGPLSLDYLFNLSGVDYGKELGVTYYFTSTEYHHILVVKIKTEDRENPSFHTVSHLWRTAEFHEREVFDLFGIRFKNHPDLRRIFLDDNWEGFPLRKDYVDDVNIIER
jgi:NADH:ubiquinone oxidoreductase subunit C